MAHTDPDKGGGGLSQATGDGAVPGKEWHRQQSFTGSFSPHNARLVRVLARETAHPAPQPRARDLPFDPFV